MNPVLAVSPTVDALETIAAQLDLSNIRFKLSNPEEGAPPSERELDLMEGEYRKFLDLKLAYPEAAVVPCKLVDQLASPHPRHPQLR